MMRELKFRAWDAEKNTMYTVSELRLYNTENAHIFVTDIGWLSAGKGTVMQYTGMKDNRNKGEELYHKDILFVGDGYCGDHLERGGNFIIEWDEDNWQMQNAKGEYLCSLWEAIYNRSAQHMGNVYENLELIGGRYESEQGVKVR